MNFPASNVWVPEGNAFQRNPQLDWWTIIIPMTPFGGAPKGSDGRALPSIVGISWKHEMTWHITNLIWDVAVFENWVYSWNCKWKGRKPFMMGIFQWLCISLCHAHQLRREFWSPTWPGRVCKIGHDEDICALPSDYDLHSFWKWQLIVDLPIRNGDFP